MPLNIDFRQVLLHLLNFVILSGALYFLLYGPVKKFMEKREQMYKDMDAKTKENLEKAEILKAEYEQKISDADKIANAIRLQAEADASQSAQDVLSDAKQKADSIIKKAHIEAQKDKDELVRSARKEIIEAAEQMAEKIVNQSVSESYDQFTQATERGQDND